MKTKLIALIAISFSSMSQNSIININGTTGPTSNLEVEYPIDYFHNTCRFIMKIYDNIGILSNVTFNEPGNCLTKERYLILDNKWYLFNSDMTLSYPSFSSNITWIHVGPGGCHSISSGSIQQGSNSLYFGSDFIGISSVEFIPLKYADNVTTIKVKSLDGDIQCNGEVPPLTSDDDLFKNGFE